MRRLGPGGRSPHQGRVSNGRHARRGTLPQLLEGKVSHYLRASYFIINTMLQVGTAFDEYSRANPRTRISPSFYLC